MIDPFNPWLWLLAGLALCASEVATSGFLLLGFGLAAFVVALVVLAFGPTLAALPYAGPLLVVAFAAIAIAIWFALAWRFGGSGPGAERGRDINDF